MGKHNSEWCGLNPALAAEHISRLEVQNKAAWESDELQVAMTLAAQKRADKAEAQLDAVKKCQWYLSLPKGMFKVNKDKPPHEYVYMRVEDVLKSLEQGNGS